MTILAKNILAAAILSQGLLVGMARAQAESETKPDPAALQAFTELVHAYRQRPALTVKSTVKIELSQGDTTSNGSEVKGEFIFGPNRTAVIKLRGFTCYLNHDKNGPNGFGTITAGHEGTDHSYYTASDDGSPYYALLNAFKDLPFPELAVELGENAIDDVLLQFHPRALNGVVPVSLESMEKDGRKLQHLVLKGESETIDVLVDPDSKLIQSIDLKIAEGPFVQPGSTMVYKHSYEYETHDQPLDPSTFTFDPGQRQRVDLMTSLVPRMVAQAGANPGVDPDAGPAENALVGKPAPPFVLGTADGKAIDLADLRGRVVILDFWASWCGPCMAALPKLHEVAKWASQQDLPVTVMTINVWEIHDKSKDTPDARVASARATWEKRGFTLPIIMDFTDETAGAYGVRGIPTTVVIRSDGSVHAVHVGASEDYVESLQHEIQDALKSVEPD